MFFRLLGQAAVPFLLASSVQQQQDNYAPSSLRQIREDMLQTYTDLVDTPGKFDRHISPTVRFSHVTPPLGNGTSTWRRASTGTSIDFHDSYQLNNNNEHNNKDNNKPICIYLPGLDGTGISAFNHQFDDMAQSFELWRLVITTEDRSEFSIILKQTVDFIEDLCRSNNTQRSREVVLVGESFGGVLASAVALKMQKRSETRPNYQNPLKGLVLVNPATAFHETNWDLVVPVLSSLQYLNNNNGTSTTTNNNNPTPYSVAGGLALSYLLPSNDQFQKISSTLLDAVGVPPPQNAVEDMIALLDIIEQRLPADILQFRVNSWLSVGTQLVNDRLKNLNLPTLVVAGDQDRIVPSDREVKRLLDVIPNSESLIVRGKGHFVLDDSVNLTEAILYSDIDPLKWSETKATRYDPITDWTPPPREEIDAIIENQVKRLRDIHSPVFFSTDKRGKRHLGLGKVPSGDDGPLLFVANHQFVGLDLGMIVAELIEQRNLFARGLAHPIVFNQTRNYPELLGRTPGLVPSSSETQGAGGINNFNNFLKFGAVEVTPKNYYKLMQSGQNGLLFPGGVKDLFQTDPKYPLKWPEKTDFVRIAAKFNATIIPVSATGMLESARIAVEAKDVPNIPFIGKRISDFGGFPAARFDASEGEREPLAPIPLPSMPSRNYFVFGKPFSTKDIDSNDKEACAKLYKGVVAETRRGLDDILRNKEHDPFQDTPRRIAYEQLTKKKAPTFEVERLNR